MFKDEKTIGKQWLLHKKKHLVSVEITEIPVLDLIFKLLRHFHKPLFEKAFH